MKNFIQAAVICAVALTACTTPFKKAKDGSEYKVITNSSGKKAVSGNFLEMNVVVKYKDSILMSTYEDGMPQYGVYDTSAFPSPFKEAFINIHEGDSIVLRMPTDSIMKRGQAAPFMKKGQYIYQSFKVSGVFAKMEQADSAQKSHMTVAKAKQYEKQLKQIEKGLTENRQQIEADSKVIEAYLAKNNLKAIKGKWGSFVVIQQEGTGSTISKNDIATVNYTGRTLDSNQVFDSNVDPKFQHPGAMDVPMGQLDGLIAGWFDGLYLLKKGSKATFYLPSPLGYGKAGRAPKIKPDQILVFDMEVVDVATEEAKMAKALEEQKKQEEDKKRVIDSLRRAHPELKDAQAQ